VLLMLFIRNYGHPRLAKILMRQQSPEVSVDTSGELDTNPVPD